MRVGDALVFSVVSLNNHIAGAFAFFDMTTTATTHLSDELKTSFGGAKIRKIKSDIGKHKTNKFELWKIQAFGNHLCAY
ncbi:hypothetical protein D3C86_2165890 [compost metagenome]